MSRHSEISAGLYNEIVDEVTDWYSELVDFIVENLMGDGFPPFTTPIGDREQYDLLNAWRMVGDPRFWDDPAAQQAFAKLGMQYAAPAPYAAAPGMGLQGVV